MLAASIARPRPGAVYNVCDDEAAPPEAVVAYAAGLLGIEKPPLVPIEQAALSPMARSFYDDNKRVSKPGSSANSASRCAIRPTARG